MDAELTKLIRDALSDNLTHVQWLVAAIGLVLIGLGVFIVSYLKKRADLLATREQSSELLRQLVEQTRATETIKTELARETARATEELKSRLALELESVRAEFVATGKEQEKRFSEWQGRQAIALTELYENLFRAEQALRPSLPDLMPPHVEVAWKAREELRIHYEKYLLFVPREIEEPVSRYLHDLSYALTGLERSNLTESERNIVQELIGSLPPMLVSIRRLIQQYLMSGEFVSGEKESASAQRPRGWTSAG